MEEEIYRLIKTRFMPYQRREVMFSRPDSTTVKVALDSCRCIVVGYKYQVDTYALRHALEKHSRDPAALLAEDFKKIPDIIQNADKVIPSKKTKQGLAAIQYIKTYANVTYFYIVEIRTGKKVLSMKTMYKSKETPSGASYI